MMDAKEFEAKLLGNKFVAPCGCLLERICSIKNYEWIRTGDYINLCADHITMGASGILISAPTFVPLHSAWVTSSGEPLPKEEVDEYLAQLSRPVFRKSRALGYKHAVLSDDGVWQVSPRVRKVYHTQHGKDPVRGRQLAKAINFGLYGTTYDTMEIAGTRTGRLSSSSPNRSNLLKRERLLSANSLETYIRRMNGEYVSTYKATKPTFAGSFPEYSLADVERTWEIFQMLGFHDPPSLTRTSPWRIVSKRESEGGTYVMQLIEMTPKWWKLLVETPWKFEEDSWVRRWMEKRSERVKPVEKYVSGSSWHVWSGGTSKGTTSRNGRRGMGALRRGIHRASQVGV